MATTKIANTVSVPAYPNEVDPDNPEALIASLIYWHPSRFDTRASVLKRLFFTADYGHRWDSKGSIVNIAGKPDDYTMTLADRFPMLTSPADTDSCAEYIIRLTKLQDIRDRHVDIARAVSPMIVSTSDYSYVSLSDSMPENARPLWAALEAEARQLFRDSWIALLTAK